MSTEEVDIKNTILCIIDSKASHAVAYQHLLLQLKMRLINFQQLFMPASMSAALTPLIGA